MAIAVAPALAYANAVAFPIPCAVLIKVWLAEAYDCDFVHGMVCIPAPVIRAVPVSLNMV